MIKPQLFCNFCNGSRQRLLYKTNPHLVVCGDCGLVYTNFQPSIKRMMEFYNEDYFISNNSIEKGYSHYVEDKQNLINTFSRRMNIIEKYHSVPGKILDVGCAAGFFLSVAKQRRWHVYGVDISKFCKNYAQRELNINIEHGLFLNTNFGEAFFDVITMWDYLEHSITPKEDVLKAKTLLKDKGLLVIATPDISSFPSRTFRQDWIGIKLEEHFFYFSKTFLEQFLNKNGFRIVESGYIGKYVSLRMVADRLIYYNKFLSFIGGRVLTKINFSFYCNPFDITYIIAKKIIS
ncbi:MAG: class I SAM-dependent methyltransferase [Candidatus Omnitrophota bacterium]